MQAMIPHHQQALQMTRLVQDRTENASIRLLAERIQDEQQAGRSKLAEIWSRPIAEKLRTGWSQQFVRLERAHDSTTLWAYTDGADSRFREGDKLVLHAGSPFDGLLWPGLTLESEEDGRWLLSAKRVDAVIRAVAGGPCYADPDTIDLADFYKQAIAEISTSQIGESTTAGGVRLLSVAAPGGRNRAHAEGCRWAG